MRHHLPLVTYFGCCIFIIGMLYNYSSLRCFFSGEAGLALSPSLLGNTLLLQVMIRKVDLTAYCLSPSLT